MKLEDFCRRFQDLLNTENDPLRVFEIGQPLLKEWIGDPSWFWEELQKMISSPDLLVNQPISVFSNEITLYRSPDKSFSILAYIWDTRSLCPIHDHSSWGIIGALFRPMREVKYHRLDDRQKEGHADLEKVSDRVLNPGEMTLVLPLDEGIHQTGAGTEQLAISIHLYGRSMRKGYLQFFYPAGKRVVRAYPPRTYKKVMALRALASAPGLFGSGSQDPSLLRSLPDFLVREFRLFSSGTIPD